MLERLCHKTEFEVEGWRKIPPLIEILTKATDNDKLSSLQLEMKPLHIKFEDSSKEKTIRNSNIYTHFKGENPKKLSVYVNQTIPINEKYVDNVYSMVSVVILPFSNEF